MSLCRYTTRNFTGKETSETGAAHCYIRRLSANVGGWRRAFVLLLGMRVGEAEVVASKGKVGVSLGELSGKLVFFHVDVIK